jgi:hypothetical protein
MNSHWAASSRVSLTMAPFVALSAAVGPRDATTP